LRCGESRWSRVRCRSIASYMLLRRYFNAWKEVNGQK
jgi:hypothetical protein